MILLNVGAILLTAAAAVAMIMVAIWAGFRLVSYIVDYQHRRRTLFGYWKERQQFVQRCWEERHRMAHTMAHNAFIDAWNQHADLFDMGDHDFDGSV